MTWSTSAVQERPVGVIAAGYATLVVLCLAQLMVSLDVTVVNVALPSITRSLHFAPADTQWVVTAYLLCTGGLTLLGGRLADLLGRRRVALAGLVIFAGASLASGLAGDSTALIVARAAQGCGAALLSPAALSIITTTYTGEARTRALAAWGAIGASGFAAGLLIGGALTSWLSWHWIFFINLPVSAVALVTLPVLVPADERRPDRMRALDLASPLLVTAGLACLVYALSRGSTQGWSSGPTIAGLVAAVALILLFVLLERRAERPFVPAVLWRNRPLLTGTGIMAVATSILGGTLLISTFVLQQELGASALRTGLDYLPLAIAVGLAAHLGSKLLPRLGSRLTAIAGLLVIAGGLTLLLVAPDHAGYAQWFLPAFVGIGLGAGLTFVAASVTAMSQVPAELAGAGSGLLATGHEIGGALGVAVLTTVATAASEGGLLASGHHTAYLVATLVAAGAAVLATTASDVRPTGQQHVTLH
jgi:EmrB/QacA subfamily drug resistance transporter